MVFEKLAVLLSVPIKYLNTFSGIVGFIWLAILGLWTPLIIGGLLFFGSQFIVSIIVLPSLIFAAPGVYFYKRNNIPGFHIFSYLGILFNLLMLSAWCIAILYSFTGYADSGSIIPIVLWAYSVAIGPIAWLAGKEVESGGGFGSTMSLFILQLAFLVVMIGLVFWGLYLQEVIIIFALFSITGAFIQVRVTGRAELGIY